VNWSERVLGIDPGSRFMGWGVVECRRGACEFVDAGVIRSDSSQSLSVRLVGIAEALTRVIKVFRPQSVAVEGVFTNKNARSALILGHARGVALLVAAQAGAPVFEYAPARVKRAIGAGGNDSKDAVARMVTTWLSLPKPLERVDAYDALAVALCHVTAAGLGGTRAPHKASTHESDRKTAAAFLTRVQPAFVKPKSP
jgi:crossover junction endodeoxyribonuclease RuvC